MTMITCNWVCRQEVDRETAVNATHVDQLYLPHDDNLFHFSVIYLHMVEWFPIGLRSDTARKKKNTQ